MKIINAKRRTAMKVTKRQLKKIIKEEHTRVMREYDDDYDDENGGIADEDVDVEGGLSQLNDALYAALPAVEYLLKIIKSGQWDDEQPMATVLDQVNEWTYDAFGEYLIDKRKAKRIGGPRSTGSVSG